MGERDVILRQNLRLMCRGQLIMIVGTLCVWIPVVNLLAVAAAVVGAVTSIVALIQLRNQHPDYWNGVVAMVVSFVLGLFKSSPVVGSLMNIGSSVASLCMIYFVIRATNLLLQERGRGDVAALGDRAWKCQAAALVVSIACSLGTALVTALTLPLAVVGLAVALVAMAVALVAMAFFVYYLNRASAVFG